MKPRSNTDIDKKVGLMVREKRISRGLSQQNLADAIGVTYQQTHKYETGINRITIGRLIAIAKALDCPYQDFFDGIITGYAYNKATPNGRMQLELGTLAKKLSEKELYTIIQIGKLFLDQREKTE